MQSEVQLQSLKLPFDRQTFSRAGFERTTDNATLFSPSAFSKSNAF